MLTLAELVIKNILETNGIRYLVVGNDNHDNGGSHLEDLVKGLDVGGGSVVCEFELLWSSDSHA